MAEVDQIAVLGAGDMGHGIAELAAMNGFTVTLRDIEEEIVEDALDQIEWSLGKLADKDQITEEQAEAAFERISGTTELPEAVGEADLVVEAVPEELSLKQKIFADVETHAPDDAVLASNTSTIRITEIGEKLEDPSRLVGMHFFNPVLMMDLIEIIPSETATTEAVETVEQVSDQLGKTYVTLDKDTPGFVTSRLIGVWTGAAQMALDAGLADKETIDAAMKFEAGFPMGPFELADYTGLDIGFHASQYISERLGDEYAPSDNVRELVEAGDLGKKTGSGFYEWEGDEAQIELSPDDAEGFDPTLVLSVVANEAARVLDEGIASPEEIDLAMRNGLAFPKGPLEWADEEGLDTVLSTLEQINEQTGHPLTEPTAPLKERVDAGDLGEATGRGFYEHETTDTGVADLDAVDVEIDPETHVGTLTLDRPHRLNAINSQLVEDVSTALETLEADEDVRVIVLTGSGDKAFSVGADLQEGGAFEPADAAQRARDGHKLVNQLAEIETPTIAAVDGYAFGGGLELTLPCDFRLASEKARFQLPEVTIGLLPGMGGTFRLPKLIGTSAAKEFVLLGERVPADRAYEMGLVHRVWPTSDFEEEVQAFAEKLASNAPIALRHAKQLVENGHDASIRQGMEAESAAFGVVASTDDVMEGVTAMFQDREPEFEGR